MSYPEAVNHSSKASWVQGESTSTYTISIYLCIISIAANRDRTLETLNRAFWDATSKIFIKMEAKADFKMTQTEKGLTTAQKAFVYKNEFIDNKIMNPTEFENSEKCSWNITKVASIWLNVSPEFSLNRKNRFSFCQILQQLFYFWFLISLNKMRKCCKASWWIIKAKCRQV